MLARRQMALLLLVSLSCQTKQARVERPVGHGGGPGDTSDLFSRTGDEQAGLIFRLSEGRPDAAKYEPQKPTRGEALTAEQTASVLSRLPALVVQPDDQQTFATRERSLPPPRTGKKVTDAFPPPTPPDVAPRPGKAGPLEVLRAQPQGDVPLAPLVSITFSQPMVEVTSLDELARKPVPATISPEPPGKWRWVGTRTVVFEAGERFPMATTFTVTVPAGTKSASGAALARAYTFGFQTPPPVLQSYSPSYGPIDLDPVLFLAFDQKIDPAAVLKTLSISAGSTKVSAHLASSDKLAADEIASQYARSAQPGRWMALELDAPLPRKSSVTITVGPGTPSLEGPRLTVAPQGFKFFTYAPLEVTETRCGWDGCHPLDGFGIAWNNPLDEKKWKPELVHVEPAIENLKIEASGNWVQLSGRTRAHTKYRVTFDAALTDKFGQTLGSPKTLVFDVGAARPAFYSPGGEFQVLDPAGGGKFSVFTTNHKKLKVSVYQVTPGDWPAFARYMRAFGEYRKRGVLPGKKVIDETVDVAGPADDLVETRIELGRALADGKGLCVVVVEPTVQPANRDEWQVAQAWVQATDIGLSAFVDHDDLRAWTTSLRDGHPLADVELAVLPAGDQGRSPADGVTTFKLPAMVARKGIGMIVARRGNDVAMLPEYVSWWGNEQTTGWTRTETPDQLGWYVADDRGMYRPGETARVKGWLRRIGGGEGGDVGGLRGAARAVSWRAMDAQGNEISKGNASVDVAGGFDLSIALPRTVNLGQVYMELNAHGGPGNLVGSSSYHYFQVQEFRRPEFEVTATAAPGPVFIGDSTTVTATARYYAGGGLPGAPAQWSVYATPASFSPPGHDDYTFGIWQPWWGAYDYLYAPVQQESRSFAGTTDAAGEHHVKLDFDSVAPPRAMSVIAGVTVLDVNRQGWAANLNLLVHPASQYIGLKTGRYFVQEGEAIDLDAIVTDLDGKLVGGRTIAMRAARVDWSWKNGKYESSEEDVQDCATTSSKAGEKDARCSFVPRQGGIYKLRAVVKDDKGRKNESEMTMWVAGGDLPPARDVKQEQVTLVPDKKEYKPGETAKLLVQAPFAGGEAIVSYRRSGILKTERLTLAGSSATLSVPIDAAYIPNLWVQVDVVGAAPRTDDKGKKDLRLPRRPAFASGAIKLDVPPRERTLDVQVKPEADKLEPGASTWVTVAVRDAKGQPVAGSQVAVVIVDEAVLALSGYKWPDPVETFYSQRPAGAADYQQRMYLVLANPDDARANPSGAVGGMAGEGAADMATGAPAPPRAAPAPKPAGHRAQKEALADAAPAESEAAGGQAPTPGIALRTNFDALALFSPAELTNAQGLVTVKLKIPDNLTRYRITAVAVAGEKQFGKGESTLTARLPLMVRPSPPRFLNFGDQLELPVLLQNQTDAPLTVDVAARATNATLKESVGRRVTVPANDRIEVRFPAAAAMPGTARFQLAAVSGKWSDASEVSLPVWTPATTEAFATYGEIDQGAIVQPIKTPGDVWTQFGGVQVTTSSTAVAALTDAFLYLVRYPYDCAEQVSSRLMAVAALKDVLKAFEAGGLPPESEILATVASDLERLKNMQNWDGGFGFWRRGDESWPYISIHAAHALERVKEKGFSVPPELLQRSLSYLKDVEQHIPGWYPDDVRRALVAYALYVRERMGAPDHARARKLIAEAGGADKLPLEVSGWLLFVLSGDSSAASEVEGIRKLLDNRVDETAAYAHFTTSYTDGQYLLLHSDRRADGVILEALIKDQPKSDLIAKVVKGLLAHRKAGRWANTNESAFVLLALDRYFEVYEKVTPDFVARVWLGDQYAGEHAFKGRTTEEHEVNVPMALLKGTRNLVIDKQGGGRLYYRIGMSYAPKDLALKPRDAGFTVLREYEGADDKKDVTRDAQGVWHVKAGARVRVKLTMVAPSRRYHVALVDPLPAGLEAMNPALAVTGEIPRDDNPGKGMDVRQWWYWTMYWYQHENLRDERVEAFTTLLWEGVYNYSYVARATTPGSFVVPPTKAEEMYNPETFGRSGTDRVVVEE